VASNSQPFVDLTVLVTCFNKLSSLDGFLLQARKLTELGCELIVIDDGSRDGSTEVLSNHLREFSNCKFIQQTNQGSAAARNTALDHSSRKYLQFLDIDDFLNIDLLLDIFAGDYLHPDAFFIFEILRVSRPEFPPHNKILTSMELKREDSQELLIKGLGYSRIIYPRKIVLGEGLRFTPTFASLDGERFILDDFFWLVHLGAIDARYVKFDEDAILYGYVKPESNLTDSNHDFSNQASLFPKATSIFVKGLSDCNHSHDFKFVNRSLSSSLIFHVKFIQPERMLGVFRVLFSTKTRFSFRHGFFSELRVRLKVLVVSSLVFTKSIVRLYSLKYATTRKIWNILRNLRTKL
jgi:glycosyltransferase involved in cell wall biosynthesis